jgi:hypothetical protein
MTQLRGNEPILGLNNVSDPTAPIGSDPTALFSPELKQKNKTLTVSLLLLYTI